MQLRGSFSYKLASLALVFAVVMVILVLQVAPGISNVIFSLPSAVAVAHNGMAALLLLTMVALVYRFGRQAQ